jgi:endoglucanase
MRIVKLGVLVLCLALLAGMLAGCQKPDEADPPDGTPVSDSSGADGAPPEPDDDPANLLGLDENVRIMDFRELTAAQLMSAMGAGWNAGNALDARRVRGSTPLQQETAWGNPRTSPAMIQLLVDTGFRTLRIPVTWEAFIGEAPDYIIDEEFMERVQEVVDYGIDRGMYVILNTHHEHWQHPVESNYETARDKLVAVWEQICARFGGYSELLIFEGMNEPRLRETEFEWRGGTEEARDVINKWNQAFVDTVRNSAGHNPKRWVMIPTHAASGDPPALRDFIVPEDDNIIVSIHAYVPYNFALNVNARTERNRTFDPENEANTRDIDSLFRRLNEHFISKGIPVVMGEMGCLNKENPEDRVAWTYYYAGIAAELGIPCVWWDNGARLSLRGESFGIMDRRAAEWWYPEIARAMVESFNK